MTDMITLVFEDCESFDAKTFSQTLEIISSAQSHLKFVVILGIATDAALMKGSGF